MSENIQDILNSEEGKKLFSEMVQKEITEKGYKAPEEITGLSNKNRELLGEIAKKNEKIKKNDEKYLTIMQKYSIMDIDELDDVLSSSSPNAKGNKADEQERALKKWEREAANERQRAEDALKQLTQIKSQFHQAEKTKTILSALSKAGVDEVYSEVLTTYFDKVVKVEDYDGQIALIADDGAQGKPFSDYFQEWTKSEKAKHYIKATTATGAGTTQSAGRTSAKLTLEQIEKLPDRGDRIKAMKENGYLLN